MTEQDRTILVSDSKYAFLPITVLFLQGHKHFYQHLFYIFYYVKKPPRKQSIIQPLKMWTKHLRQDIVNF